MELPEAVQGVIGDLNKIINPPDHLKWDWEVLHSMEDEAFHKAVEVMLAHPLDREQILLAMYRVGSLKIPRW